MKKTEVREIKVSDIIRNGFNPRRVIKTELKGSELFHSIKANGVQHPIEVRELKKSTGVYELLSGERRLAVSEELKLKTIPAIIYTGMNDADAYEKTHFENRGREDLTPLEMATDAQNLMQVYKGDVKAVAGTLGIAEKAVKMRLQLKNLSPAWRNALQTPASDEDEIYVQDLSVAHLELIARMPAEIQDDMLGTKGRRPGLYNYDGVLSVAGLRTFISARYTMSLNEVPWKLDDPLLANGAGACTKCAKRSDSEMQRELWGDEENNDKKVKSIVRCLDGDCFKRKLNAWQDKTVETAQKEHENLRVTGGQEATARYGELAVKPEAIVPAKKGEKGSFPVLVLEGAKKGISYAKPVENSQTAAGKEAGATKTLAERREQLKGQRIAIVLNQLRDQIDKGATPLEKSWSVTLMAALVAMYGGTGPAHTKEQSIKTFDSLVSGDSVPALKDWASKETGANIRTILWWKLSKDLKAALASVNATDALAKEERGKWLAALIGFDWDKAFQLACEEKKEPKSWESLQESGELKGASVNGQKKAGNIAA